MIDYPSPKQISQIEVPMDSYQSPLTRALALWKQGRGISLVLAAELLAEGYDVQALERRHRV